MKRRILFFALMGLSLIIAVGITVFCRDEICFSLVSLFPVVMFLGISFKNAYCYAIRHRGNFLSGGRRLSFPEEKEYTYTEEYEKTFFTELCVYCFVIPFYIPCAFFAADALACFLWTVAVTAAPYPVAFATDMVGIKRDVKNDRLKKQQLEEERKAQEAREELGHYR